MWSRVANILAPKQKPEDSSQPRVRMVHRWTSSALLFRWRILLTKIFAVFKHFEQVNHLKGILGYNYQNGELSEEVGQKVFRSLCAEVRVVVQKEKSEEQKQQITRVIGKEVVGKFKGVSTTKKGQPVCLPQNCSHPTQEMKKGGNAHTEKQPDGSVKNVPVQWWTCNLCHSSWERHPLPNIAEVVPSGSDVVDFGKHKGKTYRELLTNASYTKWCVDTLTNGDPHRKLQRYAVWAMSQHSLLPAPHHPPPEACTADAAAMEDETPYPEGWEAAGSVAAASSSATEAPQHFQIGQEDPNWGYTEAEIADANRGYRSMIKDLVRQDQYVLTSGGEFSDSSADQDL